MLFTRNSILPVMTSGILVIRHDSIFIITNDSMLLSLIMKDKQKEAQSNKKIPLSWFNVTLPWQFLISMNEMITLFVAIGKINVDAIVRLSIKIVAETVDDIIPSLVVHEYFHNRD